MGRKWANIVAKKTAKDGATSKYMQNSVLKSMPLLNKVNQIQNQTQL